MDQDLSAGLQAGDDLGEEILRSLRRILRRVSEHSRSLSRSAGVTVPQLLCLRALELAPGRETSVAELAGLVQLAPPTVSRILDRLERSGHVLRERRADDRRKVSVRLTPTGRKCLKSLPSPLHETFVERLNDLAPARRAEILGALEELVSMLEATDLEAAPVLMPEVDPRVEEPLPDPVSDRGGEEPS